MQWRRISRKASVRVPVCLLCALDDIKQWSANRFYHEPRFLRAR
jgi:hypothetical protein